MSIYIPGMEMPTDDTVMLRIYPENDGVFYVEQLDIDDDILNKYWAVPVPEHGDLIDRKVALDSLLNGMVMTGYQWRALDCINEIYVPTIIPADKEGEG